MIWQYTKIICYCILHSNLVFHLSPKELYLWSGIKYYVLYTVLYKQIVKNLVETSDALMLIFSFKPSSVISDEAKCSTSVPSQRSNNFYLRHDNVHLNSNRDRISGVSVSHSRIWTSIYDLPVSPWNVFESFLLQKRFKHVRTQILSLLSYQMMNMGGAGTKDCLSIGVLCYYSWLKRRLGA